MADINSSLPIRTQSSGDVAVKVVDSATPSQGLAVDASGRVSTKLTDGSGNSVTSQANGAQRALDVGINVSGVQVDPRSIRALTSSDVVTAAQGAANTASNGWPVKPTDGTNSQTFTASGEALVKVNVALPAGSNNVGKVSIQDSSGSAINSGNPLNVTIVGSSGTAINDYNTASALAANATSNHDYTVNVGVSLTLKQVRATASGKLKVEVQVETAAASGTFNTVFVGFNSVSDPNIDITLAQPITVATGVRVRVIRTNKDAASQDVYSTTCGSEA